MLCSAMETASSTRKRRITICLPSLLMSSCKRHCERWWARPACASFCIAQTAALPRLGPSTACTVENTGRVPCTGNTAFWYSVLSTAGVSSMSSCKVLRTASIW